MVREMKYKFSPPTDPGPGVLSVQCNDKLPPLRHRRWAIIALCGVLTFRNHTSLKGLSNMTSTKIWYFFYPLTLLSAIAIYIYFLVCPQNWGTVHTAYSVRGGTTKKLTL